MTIPFGIGGLLASSPALGAEISGALRALPASAHTIILAALVIGLAVWLFGRSLSRAAFGGMGLVLGGSVGWTLPAALGLTFNTWITTGLGAVIGLILGLAALKFIVTVLLGALFTMLSPLVLTGLLTISPPLDPAPAPPEDAEEAAPELPPGVIAELDAGKSLEDLLEDPALPESVKQILKDAAGLPGGEAEGDGDDPPVDSGPSSEVERTIAEGAERTRAFFSALWAEVKPYWTEMDGRQRTLYIGAAILAAALGVGAGLVLPKKSTTIVTAFVGAGLWMPSAVWLCSLAGRPLPGFLPESSLAWFAMWLGAGVLGTIFQWSGLGGKLRRKKVAVREDD